MDWEGPLYTHTHQLRGDFQVPVYLPLPNQYVA